MCDTCNRYGPNALTPPKKPGFFAKLWAQLNNVLIFILLAAAVVVAGLQEWIEFGLILGVVTLNVMIGLVQEGKAEKAADAIKAMLSSSGAGMCDPVDGGEHTILECCLMMQCTALADAALPAAPSIQVVSQAKTTSDSRVHPLVNSS